MKRVNTAGSTARDLRRPVAAVHLVLTGGLDLSTGLVLIHGGLSEWLLREMFARLPTYLEATPLLQHSPLVARLATHGAVLLGAVVVVVGAAQLRIGIRSFGGSNPWRLPATLCGLLNPLALPVAGIAAVLFLVEDGSD